MKACPWQKRHRGLGSKYWIFPSFLTQGIFQQHQSSGWTGKAAEVVAEWRWCSARGFKGSVQPCPSIPEDWQQGMSLCCGSVNPSLCRWLLGWDGKLAGLHNPRWNSCCPALVKMWGFMKLSECVLGQKWTWPGLWFLHEWFCKKQQLCSKFSARSSVRSWKKEAGHGYQQVGKTEVKFEAGTLWENWNVSSWQQHLGWDSRVQAPEGQQQEGISSQKEHSKKELHFLSNMGRGKHQAWPDSPKQIICSDSNISHCRCCKDLENGAKSWKSLSLKDKRAVLFYCRAVRQSLSKGTSVGGRARAESLDASQGFSLAFTAGICTSVLKIKKFICLINSRKKKIFEKNLTFLS